MKKTIMSMAIMSTLFAGTVGISSVLAATLDDSSDKIVSTQNVTIQSNQAVLADLNDSSQSPDLIKNLLADKNLTEKEAAMTKVTKIEKTPTVASYTVEAGDTSENIAKAFEVSMDDLAKWNEGLTADSIIQVGQKLKIQTEKDPTKIETTKLTWKAPVVETPAPVVTEVNPTIEPVAEATIETAEATPVAETPVPVVAEAAPTTGRTVTVTSTAYSFSEAGLTPYTATGIDLRQTPNVIAVDPSVIPLGSRVMVEGYGEAIAGDTGGAIVGNKIDVHFSTVAACYQWGVRTVNVTILD
ncbi:3D domain-containing protein [Carnobacterium gallinarum]|uniref:3D domain-containing protein n=1 Tax=Carnobacterium gallinarum TaxID=2749 RepID=UPI0005576E25|nr:3D domain-containing protein [Carnobacterium gallinarum]